MNVSTKFNLGDEVFTVDTSTLKVKMFTVDNQTIHVNRQGLSSITLYEKDSYTGYNDKLCFSTEEELIEYMKRQDPTASV